MAKIFGQLEKAQLENTTSDTGSLPAGTATYRTDTKVAKVSDGTSMKEIVDTSTAQTLTTKTLTSPVINTGTLNTPTIDTAFLTDQSSTPATPASGTTKFYSKTDGKVYKLTSAGVELEVGSGAGGGLKNYISGNPDAETSTTGWTTFADGVTLVDGVGGSPTGTWTRQASTILRGTNSFKWTSGTLGDGVAYAFTLDVADQAKLLQISFDYQFSAAVATAGNYQVYIYDVTNSTLIQPSAYQIDTGVSGVSYTFKGTFQTSSSGTSYRLIIWQSVGSPGGNLFVDNVSVGPQITALGGIATDWVAFTPTGSWSTNTTYTGLYRRIGDSMQIQYNVALSGAPTSATLTVNLPSGFTIDTTKMLTVGNRPPLGEIRLSSAGVSYSGNVFYNSTTSFIAQYSVTNTGSNPQPSTIPASITQAAPGTFANADYVSITTFNVPIVGWSSTSTLSSMDTQRIVAMRAGNATSQAIATSSNAIITGWTSQYDTHGSFNASTGVYTVPVAGYYRISKALASASAAWSSGSNKYLQSGVTGTSTTTLAITAIDATSTNYKALIGSTVLKFNAGDTISITIYNSGGSTFTLDGSAGDNWLSIERIPGNQTIAASETIAARYNTGAGQTLAALTQINYDTKVYDTHNAVTTGASWKFTAPASGIYAFGIANYSQTSGTVSNNFLVYKNGSQLSYIAFGQPKAGGTPTTIWQGNDQVQLVAGDTLDIRAESATGVLGASSFINYIYIRRIGSTA